MHRRLFLGASGAAFAQQNLPLKDFEPSSMLRVPETPILKPAFPVIDFHAHLCWSALSKNGVSLTGDRTFISTPQDLLPVMDRKGIRTLVNLTGGYQQGLKQAVGKI
jgi:hypothetical protein